MKKVDYHIHSNLSDGMISPEKIIEYASKNGCDEIAITDHEYLDNYVWLSKKYGINIVNGIEFNTACRNLHILGYDIKDIKELNEYLMSYKKYNEQICLDVIKKLEDDNFDISYDKIINYLESINLNCDILDKRKLVKYLIYKNYSDSVINAYNKLIGFGQKYYVPNKKIDVYDIIDLIKSCGGISILAHPYTLNLEDDILFEKIKELKAKGLEGIEIFNSRIKKGKELVYLNIADKLDLLKTVGSDFHDSSKEQIGVDIDDKIIYEFQKKLCLKR